MHDTRAVSEALLSSALDGMRECVRIVDRHHKVCYVNRRFREAFGSAEGEMCFQIFCRRQPCDNCICDAAMREGEPREKTRRFGKRVLHTVASPAYDASGEIVGAVEVIRDVTESLRERREILQRNRQLLSDLRLAERVQHALLERPGQSGSIRSYARYLPCSDIGGDIFGVLNISEQQVAFYLADVSGHGVAAAMLSVFINELVRSHALSDAAKAGPAAVLSKINDAFLQLKLTDSVYVTLLLGIIRKDTGEMTFSNAGHAAPPVLYDTKEAYALELAGPPIGSWVENPVFRERSVIMPKGSRLLLYSDGLSDERQSRLDEDTMLSLIRAEGGEALLDRLLASAGLQSPSKDDVAVLLVERTSVERGCET